MPTSTTYLRQIIVFVLDLERVFAESYVKLQYFVTILSLVTLQGRVCVNTPCEVDSFKTHCSALIDAATCQI